MYQDVSIVMYIDTLPKVIYKSKSSKLC